jgi:hypothetical protein
MLNNIKHEELGSKFGYLLNYTLPDDAFIAGGSVRDLFLWDTTYPKDVDVFSIGSPPNLTLKAKGWFCIKESVVNSRFVTTFSSDRVPFLLQWIQIPCKSKLLLSTTIIENVLSDFDFTCTKWAYWPARKCLIFYGDSVVDSVDLALRVNKITYPVDSLRRMFLYKEKGYSVPAETMKEFVIQVNATDEEDLFDYMYEEEDDVT